MTRQSENATIDFLERVRAFRAEAGELRRVAGPDVCGSSTPKSPMAWSPGILPADFLPGYAFVREIHRGGQGVVYEATQLATRRRVAIKLLRPFGPDDRAVRRFEREAELITQLRHPNVVTVFDAGQIDKVFFLVMEYVDGRPLDAFVADTRPDLKSVLRLFADVCDGVNAAHLRGVIHRDLKPANILVEAGGQARVLDFGLAKLAADPSGDGVNHFEPDSLHAVDTRTRDGQFVGSLPWASPEQAEGLPGTIDLRTDVYALGAVLYYLLAGRHPIDPSGSQREVLNRIVNTEPVTLRAAVVQGSALRRAALTSRRSETQSGALHYGVDSEIETIVLKCLSKNPARRYQSAGDLAADIRRYLAGEAIEAKRDSRWYVLHKTLLRYRAPAGIAAAFLLLVSTGLVTSIAYWQAAQDERDRAVLAEQEQSRQRERAEAGELAAKREADRARTITALLNEMLQLPAQRSPTGETLAYQEHLATFAASLGKRLEQQPEIEAEIRISVGRAYQLLRLHREAVEQHRRALEIRRSTNAELHPAVSDAVQFLATSLQQSGRDDEAARVMEDAIERARRLSGGDSETVAARLSKLAQIQTGAGNLAAAEDALRDALQIRRRLLGQTHAKTIHTLGELSAHYNRVGRFDEAIQLARQTVELYRSKLGETHRMTTGAIELEASALRTAGRYAAAVETWRDALRRAVSIHGDEHLAVGERMQWLAHALSWIPDSAAEQVALRRATLDLRRRLAPEDTDTIQYCVLRTAHAHWLLGELGPAETLAREAVETLRRRNIDGGYGWTYQVLGEILRDRGALEEAEETLRLAIQLLDQTLRGEKAPLSMGGMLYDLAAVLHLRGDRESAAACETRAAEIFRDTPPLTGLSNAHCFEVIGRHMLSAGAYESAANVLRWAVQMRAAICPGHPTHRAAEDLLRLALENRGAAAADDDAQPNAAEDADPDHPP